MLSEAFPDIFWSIAKPKVQIPVEQESDSGGSTFVPDQPAPSSHEDDMLINDEPPVKTKPPAKRTEITTARSAAPATGTPAKSGLKRKAVVVDIETGATSAKQSTKSRLEMFLFTQHMHYLRS